MSRILTLEDRIATVAACSTAGEAESEWPGVEPLGAVEWSEVAQWLQWQDLQPAHLLDAALTPALRTSLKPRLAQRLTDIPSRWKDVNDEIERLSRRGFWALARFDAGYPQRWRDRLKHLAPPVLFGSGQIGHLCATPAIAIVGSRNIDENQARSAEAIGHSAGSAGHLVVSGGARGSDRWGMFGSLRHGYSALGILHGDLGRDAQQQDAWSFIEGGMLTLVSHVHPATGFVTGNAMARNRYIHALADAAIVVATATGTGGTWQGSVDNLDRGWSPLLVWMGEGAPAGNAALVERGGYPFEKIPNDPDELRALLAAATNHQQQRTPSAQPMQSSFNL